MGEDVEKLFRLKRISVNRNGTFGVLIQGYDPFCLTVERPWLQNKTGVSCIPTGFYACRRVNSPKFGNTFEVTDVPGRSHILFHKGNVDDDSHGCIILGEQFELLGGKGAVLASGKAMAEFMERTKDFDLFYLEVRNV